MKSADSNKPAIFSGLMTDYTGQLESTQGFSLNTTKSYKDGLYTLLVYFDEVKHLPNDAISFSHLSLSEINGYLDWLENTRKCSIQTRNHRLAILKSFAKYSSKYNFRAAGEFYSAVYKIPTKRAKGKKRAFFSIEEAFIFMSLPKFNTLAGRRDSVLLVFMYFTAARAQEVCDLRVKDLEYLSDGRCRVTLNGKGKKSRQVPIPAKVADKLKAYVIYTGKDKLPDAYVFSSQTHQQMTISCIEAIFKKYTRLAKEANPELFQGDSYTPHSMRHSTAVHMLEAGISLPKIKLFLGHSFISTTEIYAEITQSSLDKSMIEWNQKTWEHLGDYMEEASSQSVTSTQSKRPSYLQY